MLVGLVIVLPGNYVLRHSLPRNSLLGNSLPWEY